LLQQRVKEEVPKACISWCCKDTCNFGTVTGSRFADFSQFLIKTDPLHGNLNVTDVLCILLGSKLINAWVCDTPETLRYWTSPENHSSSSVRVVFLQKNRWFRPFDANNEEIQNILIEGLETDWIAGDRTGAAGLPCDIQINYIATLSRYMHVQLSSYSTNKN